MRHRAGDCLTNACLLRAAGDRAQTGGGIHRVAQGPILGGFDRQSLDLLAAAFRHDQPGKGGANLARVDKSLTQRRGDGLFHVGIIQDDVGGLSAQFQSDFLEPRGRRPGDCPAAAGRSGKRNHVDIGMRNQSFAGLATADDQVEDAGGRACVVKNFRQNDRVQRRHFARLQNHRATGRQSWRDLGHDLVKRKIPWRNGGDDADRIVLHNGTADDAIAQLRRHIQGGLDIAQRKADLGRP